LNILRLLLKNPLSLMGLILLLTFTFVAVAAPWLAPPLRGGAESWIALPIFDVKPFQMPQQEIVKPFEKPRGRDVFETTPQPPSENHWLGTTEEYYDIYYGMVWGARSAFQLGVIIVAITLLMGVIVGSVAGFFGGWIDEILMRIVEIFLVFPQLIAIFVLSVILGRGMDNVMIAFITFGWTTYARYIRGEVLRVKENNYVEAAKASGASNFHMIFKHVLPNAIFPIIVVASLDIGNVVLGATALSFLGLIPEGLADWGQLIGVSRNWLLGTAGNPFEYWYTIFYPGLAISLFVLSWNLLGDAVRDVFDPRLRASRR